ncbi:MAG: YraN family protein [bacterium]
MKKTGDYWETVAKQHLASYGFKLIKQQHHSRQGEIDLIALKNDTLVFCEVKYRSSTHFGGAISSVTASKQHRIILAARHFLMKFPQYSQYNCRFDVISISGNKQQFEIQWIEDAFQT